LLLILHQYHFVGHIWPRLIIKVTSKHITVQARVQNITPRSGQVSAQSYCIYVLSLCHCEFAAVPSGDSMCLELYHEPHTHRHIPAKKQHKH
jgi:hypothetical protein